MFSTDRVSFFWLQVTLQVKYLCILLIIFLCVMTFNSCLSMNPSWFLSLNLLNSIPALFHSSTFYIIIIYNLLQGGQKQSLWLILQPKSTHKYYLSYSFFYLYMHRQFFFNNFFFHATKNVLPIYKNYYCHDLNKRL